MSWCPKIRLENRSWPISLVRLSDHFTCFHAVPFRFSFVSTNDRERRESFRTCPYSDANGYMYVIARARNGKKRLIFVLFFLPFFPPFFFFRSSKWIHDHRRHESTIRNVPNFVSNNSCTFFSFYTASINT